MHHLTSRITWKCRTSWPRLRTEQGVWRLVSANFSPCLKRARFLVCCDPFLLAFNMCPVPGMLAASRHSVHKGPCLEPRCLEPGLEPRRCFRRTGASPMPTSLMTCAAGTCTRLFSRPYELVAARIRQARCTRFVSLTCSGTQLMCSGLNGRNNELLATKSSTTSPAIPTSSKSNLWYAVSASLMHVMGPFGCLPPLFDASLSSHPPH